MKRRQKAPEEGSDWMGTYGDMVTLLLCFFVLLYSISSVDQVKWENLVKSMNPEAAETSQIVTDAMEKEGTENVPGANTTEIDQKFDEMYDNLLKMQDASGEVADIQIAKGDGYQFITFKDNVFFDGDSYVLRDEGKTVLDTFSSVIASASDAIKEIQVLGHTSQAEPNIPNEVMTDRVLSATRSAVVVAYVQQKNIIEPKKLVSAGYGQFRPIDTFDTFEGRARNRRVEILITKTGSVEQTLDEYYSQVYQGEGN
ncbi:OmpA/MotB family protein [Extibacter muris]|uniref:OmpA/MotB family protein n=1 Tax=Extibacter muris TaxID=1796622 RepID=UPI001D0655EF|nr:flagellar motor protein MotB [Extibacter muris]MCB6201393.1 flagellar motor protein MotB [Extibacter muris]MCQ4662719.1 flagellar motor protein MotB [Extibacter muris]MCQ4694166.1 flagellar motor protein MotB [Extibacter muris]